ncbi:MAG: hypothetical protein ND866_27570 [Pyrinomonadaceae bacterium]|nr:hypothetical protein [Pyrinomonadaceae bacterium]
MTRLHAEGKHPTMTLFKSRMPRPGYFGYVRFWATLIDEKRGLAIDCGGSIQLLW